MKVEFFSLNGIPKIHTMAICPPVSPTNSFPYHTFQNSDISSLPPNPPKHSDYAMAKKVLFWGVHEEADGSTRPSGVQFLLF